MNTLKIIVKRLKSYTKSSWGFEDYPVKVWKNPNAGEENISFGAGIIGWPIMIGFGNNPEEALTALKENFRQYKENNNDLPRLGKKVQLEYVLTDQIDKYEEIAVDYFDRVLKKNYYNGFYSDMSSLADFIFTDDNEKIKEIKSNIINKTILLYNVDISDVYEGPLWKIFKMIHNEKR